MIDVDSVTANLVDGTLPSGTALSVDAGIATPYDGTGTLAGFLLTDQSVNADGGDIVAPLLDHGRIVLANLPTATTVEADASTSGSFVFV